MPGSNLKKPLTEKDIVSHKVKELEGKHEGASGTLGFFDLTFGGGAPLLARYNNQFRAIAWKNIFRSDGSSQRLFEPINSSLDLVGSLGLTFGRHMVSGNFSYWFKMGSANVGDFVLPQPPNGTNTLVTNFPLTSEITAWGISADYQLFVLNPPGEHPLGRTWSFRLGGGAGYYHASWNLWNGYGATDPTTGQYAVAPLPLTQSKFAPHLSLGGDVPVGQGWVLSVDTRYLFLNFNKIGWNDPSGNFHYVEYPSQPGERIPLDLSGFRAHLGFKKYFSF